MKNEMEDIENISQKKIDEYCNQVCLKIDEPISIKNEIYEELNTNIKEEVRQLTNDGLNSESATNIVLRKYGTPQALVNDLAEMYKVKKIINKPLLYISIISGVLSILFLSVFYLWNYKIIPNQAHQYTNYLPNQENKVINGFNEETKKAINIGVENNSSIQAAWVGYSNSAGEFNEKYDYVYPNKYNLSPTDYKPIDNFWLKSSYYGLSKSLANSKVEVNAQLIQFELSRNVQLIGAILLVIYWTLFSYWAIINIKYRFGFNQRAITLILILNILGYYIFNKFLTKKIQKV
ncbi:hypothetical protein [Bacillus cereus]|uniref:hypothetical protein n=1 Tax=Bacillus cereus group TaxID=86661 RepID=UPI0018A6DF8F|nr:hypothetical protein [Bacillus cereus]MBF8118866.1 hypothetical protein [Bacillus cereus]